MSPRRFRSSSPTSKAFVSRIFTAFCLGIAAIPAGHAAEAEPSPDWIGRVEAVINTPHYQHARWGLLVADLASGEVLLEQDADKLFAPASTTKLFSVAAALEALGAESRFETPVYVRSRPDSQGGVRGDLILVANGDLTLGGRTDASGKITFKNPDHTYANGSESAEWTETDPLAGLTELARQTAASGVKRLEGEVLVDDRLFEPAESSGSGPSRVTPIMINDNLIDVRITPGALGTRASVQWRPESALVLVDAQVETVATNQEALCHVTALVTGRITVRGQIPAGHKPLLRVVEVDEPSNFTRTLFIEALRRAGIAVNASPLSTNRPELLPPRESYGQMARVALLRSPPFREEIKLILKVSHNLHASTLPLLLAAKQGGRTLSEGLLRQRDLLRQLGVNTDPISFGGGAGGSRADYTTPRATVQLLTAMSRRADFDAFQGGLPVLGVDGTLSQAVATDSPARGKVLAKTGTLYFENLLNGNVLLTSKALAGYMTTRRQRPLVFALMVNQAQLEKDADTAKEGRALGTLCEILYDGL